MQLNGEITTILENFSKNYTMIAPSKHIFRDTLESTNAYAAEQLKHEMIPEGTVIYSNYQSAGKGQQGPNGKPTGKEPTSEHDIFYPKSINPENQFIVHGSFAGDR